VVSFRGGRSANAEQGPARTGRSLFREAAVKIDSKTYPITDINENGFIIEPFDGDLVPKQRVYFDLLIKVGDREDTYRAEATVIRTTNKTLVCRFNDLRRDASHALQRLVASRLQHPPSRPN